MTNKQIYEKVNKKIMDLISKGTMPWEMTWEGSTLPINLSSNTQYRGINVWMLSATAMVNGYSHNQWLTFNQTRRLGGAVKRNEKASFVIFAKKIEKKGQDDVTEDERYSFFLYQYYNVFNIAQCDGITPIEKKVRENTPLEEAEKIIAGYKNKPEIIRGQYSPSYSPLNDKVFMPTIDAFTSSEEYYGALFHELAHSTGHESRMNRDLSGKMDKTSYSKEELIAEFTASYLRAMTGIATPVADANSASYIDGWSEIIKKDSRIIMTSASKAMRVADYILGKKK